ncbi:hypothetical protein Vretifemale_3216 [Volvox reticuliferus]|uniref:rRNA-processing protein FYV7 n=2 Tax=Volvox reticuliferus TaxID=1737510 RepID=A0A8J4C763_9CHLO|nr:hypothetical protein Vretifemale_3216 [Volvox reticuliferus]
MVKVRILNFSHSVLTPQIANSAVLEQVADFLTLSLRMPHPEKKHTRPVGAGLSLDKFAALGVSKFDKRRKLERIKKEKLIRHSNYKKLKQKLEAQGLLAGTPVKDSVAELEALDFDATSGSRYGSDIEVGKADCSARFRERTSSHSRAGPSSEPQPWSGQRPGTLVTADTPKGSSAAVATGGVGDNGLRRINQRGSATRKRNQADICTGPPSEEPIQLRALGRKPANQTSSYGEGDEDMVQGNADHNRGKQPGGEPGTHGEHLVPGAERDGSNGRNIWAGRKLSRLQRLAQQVAEEKAEKQRAKETALKEREERIKQMAVAEKSRKEQKHLYFKRNAKGQPLMRYRMDKLLSQIQKTVQ